MSRVFTGTGQYIHTPENAVYNNLAAETLAAWVYITSLSATLSASVFVKDPINAGNGFYLNYLTGAPEFFYGGTGAGAASVLDTVPLNTWTHVACTWNSAGDGKGRIYINGVEVTYSSQGVDNTPNSDAADGYYFGDDTFDDEVFGRLAEMAVWNMALTGVQIAALAASTTGASGIAAANLVGYWHLCGSVSPEPDATGNGNSGILVGAPTQGPNSPGFTCVAPASAPPTQGSFSSGSGLNPALIISPNTSILGTGRSTRITR